MFGLSWKQSLWYMSVGFNKGNVYIELFRKSIFIL